MATFVFRLQAPRPTFALDMSDFAARDPVVTTGTGSVQIGKMLTGFVRPGQGAADS